MRTLDPASIDDACSGGPGADTVAGSDRSAEGSDPAGAPGTDR